MPRPISLPKPIGCLKIADDRLSSQITPAHTIPIYGMDEIPLTRSSNWDVQSGPLSLAVSQWNGTDPLRYDFNFQLTAGVHCKTRQDMLTWIKAAHAMVSHCADAGGNLASTSPPPRVLLIVGTIVNTYGFVNNMSTNGKAPWSLAGENSAGGLPTIVQFSGQFTAAPSYKDTLVHVEEATRYLSAQEVLRRGYAISGGSI